MTATIAYIPALHQGYLNFFNEHPGPLYILSAELVREVPRLERDIRALDPTDVQAMIEGLKIVKKVQILETQNMLALLETVEAVIMPDEDVSHAFADTYLSGKDVTFIPTFLRWDKQISTTEFEVPADRVISRDERDQELIDQAMQEAQKSHDWWRQVGAVIARDGNPLLAAHNRPLGHEAYTINIFGDPRSNFDAGQYIELSKMMHAEAGLIAVAAREGISLMGASIYVSTFPCPVCAKSIAAAGITRVYYSQGYSLLDAEDILKASGAELILVKE